MTESGAAPFAEELNFYNRNKAKITPEHVSGPGHIHFPPQIKGIHSTCSSGFHLRAGAIESEAQGLKYADNIHRRRVLLDERTGIGKAGEIRQAYGRASGDGEPFRGDHGTDGERGR